MQTTVIGIRDFRKNISKFAKNKNTSYLLTVRNKPVFEIKPCLNESVELDDTQKNYYTHLEKSLDFWNDAADDNIFT